VKKLRVRVRLGRTLAISPGFLEKLEPSLGVEVVKFGSERIQVKAFAAIEPTPSESVSNHGLR
jgi:hypothetical protein